MIAVEPAGALRVKPHALATVVPLTLNTLSVGLLPVKVSAPAAARARSVSELCRVALPSTKALYALLMPSPTCCVHAVAVGVGVAVAGLGVLVGVEVGEYQAWRVSARRPCAAARPPS